MRPHPWKEGRGFDYQILLCKLGSSNARKRRLYFEAVMSLLDTVGPLTE